MTNVASNGVSGATRAEGTIAGAFRASGAVTESVDRIVSELERARAQITDVRPADPALKTTLDEHLSSLERTRGKAPSLPYVGAGIGNGVLVELADGSVKYDLTCGIGPHFFGHSDPELVRTALLASTADVAMQGYLQQNEDPIRFGETLVREAQRNSRLSRAFLFNSGAMANDNALKMAYQKNHPADRVLAFQDCFMGRTVAMCQIGDSAGGRVGVPTTIDIDYMPFFDAAAAARSSAGDVSGKTRWIDMSVWHLEQYISRYPGKHAAFVFELVQGEGGYNTAPREFFTALMDVCREHGVGVWIDEIQTFGRTLEMFAFETLELGEYVDLCTIGKLSQVCATLCTDEYTPQPGLVSGTFLGNTVGLNVGRRMIERLREGDYYGQTGRIARHHRAAVERIKALAAKRPEFFPDHPKVPEPYGGLGGMIRMTPFGGRKDKILRLCRAMFDEGVIAIYCGHDPYHVRMLPPLGVMEESQWDRVFELIEAGMEKVASRD